MATFILRQPIEGDVLLTAENVGAAGNCWTDGLGNYIPGSLSLLINGIGYSIDVPEFFALGFLGISLPPGVVLLSGDTIQIVSNCSADDSLPVAALPINLVLTASDATTCANTTHISTTYEDRVRLFLAGYDNASLIFNLSLNAAPLDKTSFFPQLGYPDNVTSIGGDFYADPNNHSVLFSNGLFAPTTQVDVLVLDAAAYFTVRLGYVEIVFSGGQINLIDYVTGLVVDSVGGGYQALDTITLRSDISSYTITKQQIPFYSVQKTVEYIVPAGGGSISPNPSVVGIDSTWTLPTDPGNYPIQVKLGDKVTAQGTAVVSGCPLNAFDGTVSFSKGSVQNALPGLNGTAPSNCLVTGFKILSLPACGILYFNGNPVAVDQQVSGNPAQLTMDIPANCPEAVLEFDFAAVSSIPGCQQSPAATITVNLQDIHADAIDDSFNGVAGGVIAHNVAANDQPCSEGTTFFQLVAGSAQHGTVNNFNQLTGYGEFAAESPGFTGQASYQYNVLCGISMADAVVIDTATVTLYFAGGALNDDTNQTYANTPVAGNVASNDVVDCQGLLMYGLQPGSGQNGLVTFLDTATGDYIFSPSPSYVGADAGFGYEAYCDGLLIGSAKVSIKVYGADLKPDTSQTIADVPVTGQVKPNDTFYCEGMLTLAVMASSELNGIVTSFDGITGEYIFTPALKFTGIGQFVYEAFCDGVKVGQALVTINVLPACDVCAELKEIKIILKKLLCTDEKILKYIHLS
ncbi:hypothetical protein [Dyadobacter sp. BHUBP1]|uniref:hypothetical protein n=1 Tax=Dyadobacter sp. BHUBP1 TaxID=3424178 RepID=UPI003D325FF3